MSVAPSTESTIPPSRSTFSTSRWSDAMSIVSRATLPIQQQGQNNHCFLYASIRVLLQVWRIKVGEDHLPTSDFLLRLGMAKCGHPGDKDYGSTPFALGYLGRPSARAHDWPERFPLNSDDPDLLLQRTKYLALPSVEPHPIPLGDGIGAALERCREHGHGVIVDMFLPNNRWPRLAQFFSYNVSIAMQGNPTFDEFAVLKPEHLALAEGEVDRPFPEGWTGHSLVVNVQRNVNPNCPRYQLKNSWGPTWADEGTFYVADLRILQPVQPLDPEDHQPFDILGIASVSCVEKEEEKEQRSLIDESAVATPADHLPSDEQLTLDELDEEARIDAVTELPLTGGQTVNWDYLRRHTKLRKLWIRGTPDPGGWPGLPEFPNATTMTGKPRGELQLMALPRTLLLLHIDNTRISGRLDLCLLPPQLTACTISRSYLEGSVNLSNLPLNSLTKLYLFDNGLEGSLDLQQLPPSLTELVLFGNRFSGEVNLSQLPSGLLWLSLWGNNLQGSLDLQHLPSSLKDLFLHGNRFSGEVDLTRLPDGLGRLRLSGNMLEGSLDLQHLPSSLKELLLDENKFTGEVNLTKLPPGLELLSLFDNQLAGPLDLQQLPSSLKSLRLEWNQFSGEVNLTQLPPGLKRLYLFGNQLEGLLDLRTLPPSLKDVQLQSNCFRGEVNLTQLPPDLELLDLCDNQLGGPLDLKHLPSSLKSLRLDGNQFSGNVDLSQLPPGLMRLSLCNNQLEGSLDLQALPSSLTQLRLDGNRFNDPEA